MYPDPRRTIARLAAALMAADDRITSTELAAVAGLERLGLGSLEAPTREALIEATRAPIDVRAACAALADVGPDAAALVLAVLADLVTSDGVIDPREGEMLAEIGAHLRMSPTVSGEIMHRAAVRNAAAREGRRPSVRTIEVRAAEAAPAERAGTEAGRSARSPAPPPPAAYAALGLPAGASDAAVEDAYRAVVERYQPAKVIDLGPEFAVLAVRRLAAATAAYTALAEARREG